MIRVNCFDKKELIRQHFPQQLACSRDARLPLQLTHLRNAAEDSHLGLSMSLPRTATSVHNKVSLFWYFFLSLSQKASSLGSRRTLQNLNKILQCDLKQVDFVLNCLCVKRDCKTLQKLVKQCAGPFCQKWRWLPSLKTTPHRQLSKHRSTCRAPLEVSIKSQLHWLPLLKHWTPLIPN